MVSLIMSKPILSLSSRCLPCSSKVLTVAHSTCRTEDHVFKYLNEFQNSISEQTRCEFWHDQAHAISWIRKPELSQTLTFKEGKHAMTRPQWFKGGLVNACENCVDRHVLSGHGDQVAIIHDSPVTQSIYHLTYSQLFDKVNRLAHILQRELNVGKGDRVLIYLPMIPEAVITMLACARIGAVHSLVFGGFASRELSTRIDHAQPKVVVSASYGIEPTRKVNYKVFLNNALSSAKHKVDKCIIYQRPELDAVDLVPGMDLDFGEMMSHAKGARVSPVALDAMDPLYILYTSGTTGQPKAIVRPVGGHLVMLSYSMRAIMDVHPSETYFAGSDLGWVVGHSYICYAPLLNRNKTIIFEGKPVGTPDVTAYYRMLRDHGPVSLFTAPTALRAIKREDPNGDRAKNFLPFNKLRSIFVAGEHLDIETLEWAKSTFQVPVIDHFWQTESGSPILSVLMGRQKDPNIPLGSSGKAVPGFDVRVVNSEGKMISSGKLGHIVIRTPLPPGFSDGLYRDEDNSLFVEKYFSTFEDCYDTQDTGFTDVDGYVSVLSRTDDVINVAGHRLSTSALEEVMLKHDCIVECAVIPVPDDLKGTVPLGVAVLNSGVSKEAQVAGELVALVRRDIGPVAAMRNVLTVSKLPKTRSGKISRTTMASLANNAPFSIPPTIEDASAYDELLDKLQSIGLALKPQMLNRKDFVP
ncbi:acyl-CoA synthetase short-chain family member 3, mitochondrial-like [Convolutriloba macropyga]|uniref:acyl-CoA synthetase short-chain family member 3, mitochondrial-like n=1 Tax=Convolutriloba macropyga TaxID=536237 RepID=UPI003F51B3A7